jgi:hypothetical protein
MPNATRTPLTMHGYQLPRRPHGLLADMLMLADELMQDNDVDYTAWLDGLATSAAVLTEQELSQPEWPMFLQALRCLNTASYADRWRWIAIVSALRPMIEIALERMEAGVKHKLRKSEVN